MLSDFSQSKIAFKRQQLYHKILKLSINTYSEILYKYPKKLFLIINSFHKANTERITIHVLNVDNIEKF